MPDVAIVDLPFTFLLRHRGPHKHRSEPVTLRELLPVQIRRLRSSEAPVAVEIPHGFPPLVMREVDGRLFVQAGVAPLSLAQFTRLADERAVWNNEATHNGPFRAYPGSSNGTPGLACPTFEEWTKDRKIGQITESDREARRLVSMRRLTSEIVEIDGRVWMLNDRREPCIVVSIKPGRREEIEINVQMSAQGDVRSDGQSFRLDRVAQAVDFAKHLGASLNAPVEIFNLASTVHRPEALQRDDFVDLALQMARFWYTLPIYVREKVESYEEVDASCQRINRAPTATQIDPLDTALVVTSISDSEAAIMAGSVGVGAARFSALLERLRAFEGPRFAGSQALMAQREMDAAAILRI